MTKKHEIEYIDYEGYVVWAPSEHTESGYVPVAQFNTEAEAKAYIEPHIAVDDFGIPLDAQICREFEL